MKTHCTAIEPFTKRVYQLPDAPDGCSWEADFYLRGGRYPLYTTYVDLIDSDTETKHSLSLQSIDDFPNPYYMGYTLLEHLKNHENIEYTYNGYTGKEK